MDKSVTPSHSPHLHEHPGAKAGPGQLRRRLRPLAHPRPRTSARSGCARPGTRRPAAAWVSASRWVGFNYFVKVNVALANRGLPQLDLPPFESLEAQLALPLLTQKLLRPLGEVLIGCAPGPCESPGPAPPPGG